MKCLTGELPFAGDYEQAVVYAILNEEPKLPIDIPSQLQEILKKILMKNPDERYTNAEDLLVDLNRVNEYNKINQPLQQYKRKPALKTIILSSVTIFILIAAIFGILFYPSSDSELPIKSLAILPFDIIEGKEDLEFLRYSLPEALIFKLSSLPNLHVSSRASAFRFRSKPIDPSEIGKILNVDAVLLGWISQRGKDISISVEVSNTQNNNHIWGQGYQLPLKNIQMIEHELITEIIDTLRIRFSGEERQFLQLPITRSNEAYLMFLKGRHFMHILTTDGFDKGRSFLNQAISLDPEFTRAYIGLAEYYIRGAANSIFPRSDIYREAKKTIDKLEKIAPNLPQTWLWAASFDQWLEWDWEKADNKFKKAIELNFDKLPKLEATDIQMYAWYLDCMNRHEEAYKINQQALLLDPLSPLVNMSSGYGYLLAGLYDKAIVQINKVVELDSNYYFAYLELGMCYGAKGMYESALMQLKKADELKPGFHALKEVINLKTLALSGRKDEVNQKIQELITISEQNYISPDLFAWIYSTLNKRDEAFKWLNKAYEERAPILSNLNTKFNRNYAFENISLNIQYNELIKKVGLDN